MADEDVIILEGITFPVKGVAQANAQSEFETGIKVGSPTYDERTQAFYITMEDFSGGFGVRRRPLREPQKDNTWWDTGAFLTARGADLRRARHFTAPPATALAGVTFNQQPIQDYYLTNMRNPSYPYVVADQFGGGAQWVVGVGNAIYNISDPTNWTKVDEIAGNSGGKVEAIVQFTSATAVNAGSVLFACYSGGGLTITSGNARYRKSTDGGATWINGATNKVLHDAFVWDNKVLAAYGNSIIFAILNGTNESWNIDDINDGQPICTIPFGYIHFIGVALAPWGEPAVWFTDGRHLWVLDFFARKAYQVRIGFDLDIEASTIWNGRIILSDGWNVFAYDSGRGEVENIGMPLRDGFPASMTATDGTRLAITYLIPSDNYLFAVATCLQGTGFASWLLCYNGKGWAPLSQETSTWWNYFGFISDYPTRYGLSATQNTGGVTRTLNVVGATDTIGGGGGSFAVSTYTLPNLSNTPVVGQDAFSKGVFTWYTSWIDGGFADIEGVVLKLNIDALGLDSTHYVQVQYQLDNDETTAATSMVDINGSNAARFNGSIDTLYFPNTPPQRGLQFRTIRFVFKIWNEWDGSTEGSTTSSPEIRGFTLTYFKKPNFRSNLSFTIDINKMIEESGAFAIDGEHATLENVWKKLIDLWNTQTLLELKVPSLEPLPLYVSIQNMPVSFDDFRKEVGGKGSLVLKFLEIIPRAA